ncbi:MAG: hypothetical protein ACKVQR_18555 [Aquabacterium sp.]
MATDALKSAPWKAAASKFKVPDIDLGKALVALEKLADDDFEARLKTVDAVLKAAQTLLKGKEAGAHAGLKKQLEAIVDAAQGEKTDLPRRKATAAAEAAAKAKADKDKARDAQAQAEKDEEEGTLEERLKSSLKNLRTAKAPYNLIVNELKPIDFVWVSRATIGGGVRAKITALTASKKYSKLGTVTRVDNILTIDLPGAGGGMATRIQKALVKHAGVRFKIILGGEVADDQDEGPAGAKPGAGKPPPAPPKPKVDLVKTPALWTGTRQLIQQRVGLLKKAVRAHYKGHGEALLAEIDKNIDKLDDVTDKLDDRLSAALASAAKAPPDKRAAELAKARAIVGEYVKYIKDSPMVDHIDRNPFGVATQLETLITNSLNQVAKAIA